MDVLAHYLDIEWESEDVARRVTVSTYPIDIEAAQDGTLYVEVSIFRDFAPWLGLQLSGDLTRIAPATVNTHNDRMPWRKVVDEHGGVWWIPSTGWNKQNGRHMSEMHRSFGSFAVELGPSRNLMIDAVALDLNRAHAQEYLDDFEDELIWLAIGQPTGATGQVRSDYSRDLVNALEDFMQAAGRVLAHPARDIREVIEPAPSARLRPNADTFRAAMRRPGARLYPGRVAQESPDVPENRYVRGMVEHCRRLAGSVARSSGRHQGHLAARAVRENARAAQLLAMDEIEIDPVVFDNQLADIRQHMDAIGYWKSDTASSSPAARQYQFTVGGEYKGGKGELLYRNADPQARRDDGFAVSVLKLPDRLHELVAGAFHVDRAIHLDVVGQASIDPFETRGGKKGRRATFDQVDRVIARSPTLEKRQALRSHYERNGWRRPITSKERVEYRSEARTAQARAVRFQEGSEVGADVHSRLRTVEAGLVRQNADWAGRKVKSSSVLPMGMRFVQNPTYAAALAAFQKVVDLERRTGIGAAALDKLGRINTLHASALYERWCLIKIIAVLAQDFDFVPQTDWVERVVTSVCGPDQPGSKGLSLDFRRSRPAVTARLDIEPVLANGRRPDFRLRFVVSRSASAGQTERERARSIFHDLSPQQTGLVMDAKFRTRWRRNELADMLKLLVETKRYGQDGDRVFILQPARNAVDHRTSPLGWGQDCDYGQASPTDHARGSIQLAADPVSSGSSLTNLRRLIALELQDVFPEPLAEELNDAAGAMEVCRSTDSFCISCGNAHELGDVTPDRTEAGNRKWYFKCSDCGGATMETHCFGCGKTLYKNGLQMTYHLTVADQVSNVVCQQCGSGF
jgi:hypothetical protein